VSVLRLARGNLTYRDDSLTQPDRSTRIGRQEPEQAGQPRETQSTSCPTTSPFPSTRSDGTDQWVTEGAASLPSPASRAALRSFLRDHLYFGSLALAMPASNTPKRVAAIRRREPGWITR
jgi:hypothetical protein